MLPVLLAILFVMACCFAGYILWVWRVRTVTSDRLGDRVVVTAFGTEKRVRIRPVIQRYQWVPWVIGILVALGLVWIGLPNVYAVAFGIIVGLLCAQFEGYVAERKLYQIETQLSDALDLMIGALHAGATISGAMESAAREIRQPLRNLLEDVLSRIQYGDDPQMVLRNLFDRIPTENFRLFTTTLSVHWEVGGSLAPVLASVGRTIRDRLEVERRLRALTAQSRISTFAILVITYLIAYFMYTYNPPQFKTFILTTTGQYLVAIGMILQAVGIYVQSQMSKVKF